MTDEVRTQVVTEFKATGEQPIQVALSRVRKTLSGLFGDTVKAASGQDLLAKSMERINRQAAFEKMSDQLAVAIRSGQNLNDVLAGMTDQLEKIGASEAEINRLRERGVRIIEQQAAVRRAGERFDETSRNVGLFGDVQSNLGALASLSGNQNIAVAGEIAALAEELPRLKTALAGVPAQFAEVARTLGGGSVAAGVGVVGATLAFIAVLGELQRRFEANKAAALESLSVEARLELLRTTGNAEDVKAAESAARTRQEEALAAVRASEAAIERIRASVSEEEFTRIQLRASTGLGEDPRAAELRAAQETIDKFVPIADAATRELIGLQQVREDERFVTHALAEAEGELAAKRTALNDRLAQVQIGLLANIGSQSTKSIDDRIQQLRAEQAAINEFLKAGEGSPELLDELRQRLAETGTEISTLAYRIRPLVAEREAETAQLEDQQRIMSETAAATEKFNDSLLQLQNDTKTARLNIEEDYANKIVDLTRKYTADVEKATEGLVRKQQDLVRDVGRDVSAADREARFERLQEQIEFNNETAKQARDLERELSSIREDSAAEREDLIRNRDFAGLRRLDTERNRALDQAVDAFNAEQREREIAFRQQQEQTNLQLQFEAESRRIQFEQAVEDARIAYARQRDDLAASRREQEKLLADSRNRELQRLAQTESQKLAVLSQAYSTGLRLASQTAQQLVAIEQAKNNALLAQARLYQLFTGGGGGTTNTNASFSNVFNIQSGTGAAQLAGLGAYIANEVRKQIQPFFN